MHLLTMSCCAGVAALALAALDELLQQDGLDFYKAWPWVARMLPPSKMLPAVGASETQPARPAAADSDVSVVQHDPAAAYAFVGTAGRHSGVGVLVAGWVRLLRFGVLDALVMPEVAAALMQLLWMATTAQEAQVRAAAYASLAAWPPTLLVQLDILQPAAAYLAPLAAEAAAAAAAVMSNH
eukprot:GHRR01033995.1.p1 GENE.GHRR01033995.1~~GHRR01033995.1.p1  ORF type:complete len:182 (+),score=99.10 GHRR01033995.1:442-987(+)